jgi:hypothetical protein
MAGEAQQIKTSVFTPGGSSGGYVKRHLTLDRISEWIRLQGFDEYTTNGLIELAERYPTQALPSFRKNFNLMIQRVRQKRKQETEQPVDDRPIGELPLGESPAVVVKDDWEKETQDENQSNEGGDSSEQRSDGEVTGYGDNGLIEHA